MLGDGFQKVVAKILSSQILKLGNVRNFSCKYPLLPKRIPRQSPFINLANKNVLSEKNKSTFRKPFSKVSGVIAGSSAQENNNPA